jgi:hypothetical protein
LQTRASNFFIVAALTADGSPKVVVAGAVAPGLALAVGLGVADVVAADVGVDFAVDVDFADAVALVVGLASLAETSEVDAFALGVELADVVGDAAGVAVLLADPLGVGEGVPDGVTLAGAVDVPV